MVSYINVKNTEISALLQTLKKKHVLFLLTLVVLFIFNFVNNVRNEIMNKLNEKEMCTLMIFQVIEFLVR